MKSSKMEENSTEMDAEDIVKLINPPYPELAVDELTELNKLLSKK